MTVQRRLYIASGILALVVVIGALGYWRIGNGRWDLGDCFYMTVITIATVGYSEVLTEMSAVPFARLWTVAIILFGAGTVVYFTSALAALIIEGDLQTVFRRGRVKKAIDSLSDHIVVCGAGSTGIHVIHELMAAGVPFVVVDRDAQHLERILGDYPKMRLLHVTGDATDDDVLVAAGIERARGCVISLHEDKDNLYVALSARSINPRLRIVARAVDQDAVAKIRRAGADSVVSPNTIGGLRMASEMLRPNVVEFLDVMLRDKDKNLRFEELTIAERSPVAGKAIRDANLRQVGEVLVVAIRWADGRYIYSPGPDVVLEPGCTMIVIGAMAGIAKLRSLLAPS
ncbi:MAG: potassium channel protein [Deltaproteobacteria bacterium]|nr:potassium channel protein [Deltaproteobacteria bacterium]